MIPTPTLNAPLDALDDTRRVPRPIPDASRRVDGVLVCACVEGARALEGLLGGRVGLRAATPADGRRPRTAVPEQEIRVARST
ncbi:hypothetical protein [Kitasatospora sp. NBC_00315]|uniref:hypothetical protein n=1 Tax=Kitasatospora sp. NBC_00315 TaxID=2975963 RepID=UPI0032471EB1